MYSKAPVKTATDTFRTFEDLEVYQAAREFRKAMYAVTRRLPAHEKFELASQIRRAAVSLTNNIAEGHGRYHYLEQIKFTLQARGSLQELIDDLNICDDEHYLPANEVASLKQQGWRVYQLANGYIRYLRERKAGASLELHESSPAYGLTDHQLDDMLNEPIQPFNDLAVKRT
ncbi:MAG: four helix bundle protein [Verrucomicrobiota bacterium]|jgi:four helix bundle protein